jgi:Fe2+ transport system protein FeoA
LQDKHILPGQEITILEAAPMDGPLTLQIDGKEVALGLQLAEYVLVKPKSS